MAWVISFIGVKGGVGKSTLARALAVVAAHGGLKVRLVDLDVKQQASVSWSRERADQGRHPAIDARAYEFLDDALAESASFDIVIIDTPGSVSAVTLDIAAHSHVVVCPTGPSRDDLRPTVLLMHELVAAGIPAERLVAALCRTLDAGEERDARAYVEHAGFQVLLGCIPEKSSYRLAQNRGGSLAETNQRALNDQADVLMEALLTKAMAVAKKSSKKLSKKDRRA